MQLVVIRRYARTIMLRTCSTLLIALLLAAGCGDDNMATDAGFAVDADVRDAGFDAGEPAQDAGAGFDAGSDASTVDAGADAGTVVDAGSDAGAATDSGSGDPDAGAACGDLGKMCTGDSDCGGGFGCNGSVCLPTGRPICGGFAGATCPAGLVCQYLSSADFGPCLTPDESACACMGAARTYFVCL